MPTLTRLASGPLQTERQSDGRRRLLRDLVIEVDGLKITVPMNTLTDFSTIPWFGRFLVRWSKVDIAGVVHDWLYRNAATSKARTIKISRKRADKIWRLVALAGKHHANAFQAWVGWLALRIGACCIWRRLRKKDPPPKTADKEE